MLEAQRGLTEQTSKNGRTGTRKFCLKDTVTARILIVQDAVRVFQCLNLRLSALHTFFITHARISDASGKELLPRLRSGIEEPLLSLDLLELRSDRFGGRRQIIRRRRQCSPLRADAHLRLALVVNELLLLRRLQLLRIRDGPLEVTQDHFHHPDDPSRRALSSGVRPVEARVWSIILDRGLLNEALLDSRLCRFAVEVAQNLECLLDGAHANLCFTDSLLVLCLLLSTRFRLVGVVRVECRDLLLKLRFLQSQLLLTCVQLLKTSVQILDILQTVVAILHRLRDLFVAPALVIRLVSLLLKQLLDHILNHSLDLDERVLRHLERKRREHRTLELLASVAEDRNQLGADHILIRLRRNNASLLHQAKRSLRYRGLLDERNLQVVIFLSIALEHRAPAALTNFSCLRGHRPLQDGQCLRDRGKLGGAHRRALIPLLCLELALNRQVLQIRAVIVQHRVHVGHVALRRRDCLRRRGAFLVLLVQRLACGFEHRLPRLLTALIVRDGLRFCGLKFNFLVSETLQELFHRADNIPSVETVVRNRNFRHRLLHERKEPGVLLNQAHGVSHIHRSLHQALHTRERLCRALALDQRRRLQRLDRVFQLGYRLAHIQERRVERGLLLRPDFLCGLDLFFVISNLRGQVLDVLIKRIAVRGEAGDLRLQVLDRLLLLRNGFDFLVRFRLAEASKLVVSCGLGLALRGNLRLKLFDHLDHLLDGRNVRANLASGRQQRGMCLKSTAQQSRQQTHHHGS